MTKRSFIPAFIFALALTLPGLAAQGEAKGQAKGHVKGKSESHGDDYGDKTRGLHRANDNKRNDNFKAVKAFGKKDRDLIVRFYREHQGGLPPGLAKRETLTPGHRKQLRRNGQLPPGLEDKIEPFPRGLAAQFPPLLPGYRRGIVGGMAVIYQPGGLIVDVVDLR